jgi:asparagine synthase (glutamine-hydrolysing)
MFNEDKSVVIVYNGELYNYKDIRNILLQNGYIFKTQSDTEVIIHAYEEWGMNCITKFNGMWAFALWDDKKQALFCARDRFGIKPFYYTFIDNTLIFASEIKALLVHPDIGASPNEFMVEDFLSNGLLDHMYTTMFTGIYQIEPGGGLLINGDGSKRFLYSDLEISSNIESPTPDDSVASNLYNLLHQSIRRHLQSDVPVGTCLSGGIDSSVIVGFINSFNKSIQHTFSACFSDKKFDESHYMKLMLSNKSICPHYVEPLVTTFLEDLDNLIYTQDEPFGSLSIYAQYCVMREAHGHVKVLLDGQGADELFGGYLSYQQNYIKELVQRKRLFMACKELLGSVFYHPDFYMYAIPQVIFRNKRKSLFTYNPITIRYRGKFNIMLHNELFVTNLPALLHYEDRNSMAFSIEARVPYLDMELTNYVASLPYNQKIRNGITKYSLRNSICGIIPEEIRIRMDKMGFVTPEEVWMKEDLKHFIMSILTSESFKTRSFWNSDKVLEDYIKFVEGHSKYSPEIWRIVCTELWLRKFFDNRSTLFSGIL